MSAYVDVSFDFPMVQADMVAQPLDLISFAGVPGYPTIAQWLVQVRGDANVY